MCYSALVRQDLKRLGFQYSARIDEALFEDLFIGRARGRKVGIPRALEANEDAFSRNTAAKIGSAIVSFREKQLAELEADLFSQKQRRNTAARKLSEKPTKGAEKEVAVAERQIQRIQQRLDRLKNERLSESDSRIYAFDWAPVIVWRDGGRVIIPMRYHLRPPGMQPDFDRKYPGCYNARRDSLTGFWRREFGAKHAIVVIQSFFEHVNKHDFEGRKLKPGEKPENLVIEFRPEEGQEMIVPCIWDEWRGNGERLLSFALVTDEPPPEVSAAGHDRCPIFLRPNHLDAWLRPQGQSDAELFRLLDDRERPYYKVARAG